MALVYKKDLDAGTAFAIWKIEETAEELYRQLQLREHEEEYLESLNNGKRNLHWLSTRVLLRKMLDTPGYIDLQADEHGKPELMNLPHCVSLSHSFEYAAVMISERRQVGIDIELVKTKIERVAAKFMRPEELDFIDAANRIEHLYVCWCAKEAVYKLQGKKNVSFLQDIRVLPFAVSASGALRAELRVGGRTMPFTVHYERFHQYMIGYVAE